MDMIVQIREVNVAKHLVIAQDRLGSTIHVYLNDYPPVIPIPVTGEVWRIRQEATGWILSHREEMGQETTPITSLKAGDRRLEAPGALHLNGAPVFINGEEYTGIAEEGETLIPVRKDNIDIGAQPNLNFFEGTNINLAVVEDKQNHEIDVNIASETQVTDGTTSVSADVIELLGALVAETVSRQASITIHPPGIILPYGGTTAPMTPWRFLMCDGTFKQQATYPELFNIIGHTFNGGTDPMDGTFKLPNTAQVFLIGKATSGTGSVLGGYGGAIDHTHTLANHTHTLKNHTHTLSHTHGISASGSLPNHGHTAGSYAVSGTTGSANQWVGITNPGSGAFDYTTKAHDHSFSSSVTGTSNSTVSGTVNSTGSTSSQSTSTTSGPNDNTSDTPSTNTSGTSNPPFVSVNFIISF